jgi:hypothetical protein
MADAVATKKIAETGHKSVFLLTNVSDGAGETGVTKVDISTLPGAPTRVRVNKIAFCVSVGTVELFFDRTTDQRIAVLSGSGELNYENLGGLQDAGSGDTGDIKLTTRGHAANGGYTILLELEVVE